MKTRIKIFIITALTFTSMILNAQPYSISTVYDDLGIWQYKEAPITVFDNKLVFYANNPPFGQEVFAYDGITPPYMIEDINVGSGSYWGSGSCVDRFVECNNKLYFEAFRATTGYELWYYDGDTIQVIDLIPGTTSSSVGPKCSYNGLLFLVGWDNYIYDETQNPPIIDTIDSYSYGGAWYNNKFYTIGHSSPYSKLLSYDEFIHNQATVVIDSLTIPCNQINQYFIVNNKMVFTDAFIQSDGVEVCGLIYEFDANSTTLMEIGTNLTCGASLAMFNNKLYFCAADLLYGFELWVYDGVNPPSMVANINLGTGSSPHQLTVVNGKLFFLATDNDGHSYLWVYDGVNAPYKAILTPLEGDNFIVFNNNLYFTTEDTSPWYNSLILHVLNDLSGIEGISTLNVNIFPNPTKAILNIELKNATSETHYIEISNILGQKVYTGEINTETNRINTENWNTGLYNVVLYNNDLIPIYSKKIIKE